MLIQRRHLLISDDSALLKQIQPTQAPEVQYLDCKPILKMVQEMFNLAMAEVKQVDGKTVKTEVTTATEGEKAQQDSDFNLPADISQIINRLSIEAAYSDEVDAHSKTMIVLNILSSFSWEAKVVISLAALALNYGKYLLLSEVYLSEKLPEPIGILKGLGDIRQHSEKLKSQLSQVNNLIVSMLDLAKCIVEFTELLAASSSLDVKAFSSASDAIMSATYWTIRGALASASNIRLEGISPTTELLDLSQLMEKMGKMKEQLQNQLELYRKHIEEKKQRDTSETLALMIRMQHIDNLKVLEALLCVKEDQPPLFYGSNKRTANLEVLRKKIVLLMLTGLDITVQDLDMVLIRLLYENPRMQETSEENEFEVVWVPILDPSDQWTPDMEKKLDSNRTMMPWYSLNHPNMLDQPVINFMKESFHYQGQTVIVVLDPKGKMVNTNAIDMIWIWVNRAVPFSQAKEEELWKHEILGLQLIADRLHHEIEKWVDDGKYIVLYGGDNVEWIRKFVTTTKQVRQAANISLEIVYVGMSSKTEQEMSRLMDMVTDESLGDILSSVLIIRVFWKRIEHMTRSKIRLGSNTAGEDPVLQGIMKLQSYDQGGRWASLFKGNELVLTGHGDLMLTTMERYSEGWQENANKEFDVAFKEYVDSSDSSQVVNIPSTRIIVPSAAVRNIDVVVCAECGRRMEKYIMFRCDHGTD